MKRQIGQPLPRSLDGKQIEVEAAALVALLIGAEALNDLVATMLDHEVPPVFLWRMDQPPLQSAAQRCEQLLDPYVESLHGWDQLVLQAACHRPGADREPARALLEAAAAPGYFALPASVLQTPSLSSRVFAALPSLAERLDNRGLLDIAGLDARPDVLLVEDWAIPYHQLLRRGFSSHVNDALIGRLLFLTREGASVRLAVDERRLHRRADHVRIEERDYWHGPPLDERRLDDPNQRAPEVLVHRWPEGADRLPWDACEQASIRTTLDGNIRTVEIEEVIDPGRNVECTYQLVRYAHSQRDIEKHQFVHLDGAVRFYEAGAYDARRGAGWPTTDSQSPSGRRKVFRIDGDIDAATWGDLVALWFRGNELVGEALRRLAGDNEKGGRQDEAVRTGL